MTMTLRQMRDAAMADQRRLSAIRVGLLLGKIKPWHVAPPAVEAFDPEPEPKVELAAVEGAPQVEPPETETLREPVGIPTPTITRIIWLVAKDEGITVPALKGQSRMRDVCAARQRIFWLARALTGLSYPQIGRFLGKRDHTTILHGVRSHAARNGIVEPDMAGANEIAVAEYAGLLSRVVPA